MGGVGSNLSVSECWSHLSVSGIRVVLSECVQSSSVRCWGEV